MKNAKQLLCTVICAVFLPLPWTIFPLRTNQWALEMPAARIIIILYAVTMILGGIFSGICYGELKVRNPVMKICLPVNLAYAVFGAVALMMINV